MMTPEHIRAFFGTREPGLSNAELAQAIAATKDQINKTGTACASYQPLVEHLRKLLAEQIKRATVDASAERKL